jgi:hypothetical protein
MKKAVACLSLVMVFISCSYFKQEAKPEAIARAGDSYLYLSDIKDLLPSGTSKEDSLSIVRNFIDRWASQTLLIKAAEVNVSKEKQLLFDKLIQQYKVDLYTKAYLEEIVKQSIDTIVSEKELKAYYDLNKENFKTNGALLKLRYIHLPKDHPKMELIKQNFFNFKKKDSKFWETYQLQFKDYALNDSVWVDINHVYRKLPFVNPDSYNDYIAPGKAIQKPDSLDVYLVKISNVIEKNEVSPYVYIKPTLRDLIINQRKLELIKKFENELRDDAIKNNKYEVYQ